MNNSLTHSGLDGKGGTYLRNSERIWLLKWDLYSQSKSNQGEFPLRPSLSSAEAFTIGEGGGGVMPQF